MLDQDTLDRWKAWARRDDWHTLFVGSDIRQMLGEIDRLQREALGLPPPIESNMIVTPAQTPGEDATLELDDDARDLVQVGKAHPVVTAATPPKLPADEKPMKIFTDPRLDPKWKPPGKK